jgi:hypothetical protein
MVQGVRREWIKRTRIPQNRAVTHATVPGAPVRPAAALSDAGRTHGALEMNENILCDTNEGPQNNILVGQTSFGNEKLCGPYLKRDNYTSFSITALKLPER